MFYAYAFCKVFLRNFLFFSFFLIASPIVIRITTNKILHHLEHKINKNLFLFLTRKVLGDKMFLQVESFAEGGENYEH